jgi:hypothetical protein
VEPFRIEVVEKGSRWPVPLVELITTHQVQFQTDNAGVIAVDAPDLFGREVWFEVRSPGYEVAKDGFGYRGVRLRVEPGKSARVELTRTVIARRLGRLTGAGLYCESQKLGEHLDEKESGVFGCDSVQNAIYQGRLFWVWGDTTMPHYPLGIFDASGATTDPRPLKSFQPPLKLPFNYVRGSNGTVRGVAPIPGSGPTWLSAMTTLPDASGKERLVATYAKIKPPLDAYEWGLAAWNDAAERFDPVRVVWRKSDAAPRAPSMPDGHACLWKDSSGKEWVLFGNPLPALRCPARFEAWSDTNRWETLKPQASLRSADGSSEVKPHSGSIAWNPWRKRWVTVFMQSFGKPSTFGELWYAEADSPLGPWGAAVKVLSHQHYTFYNPRLHPEFTDQNTPVLLFEGTYTITFSDGKQPTPRYEYNQILYRLDLDDPALAPAQK